MFHAKDGWFFDRLEDGSVAVYHNPVSATNATSPAVLIMTASEWASVVAGVSSPAYDAFGFHVEPVVTP